MQSKNKFELNINFEGTTIETSDLAKFLGIHVDCYGLQHGETFGDKENQNVAPCVRLA